jgi:hypothetical protein
MVGVAMSSDSGSSFVTDARLDALIETVRARMRDGRAVLVMDLQEMLGVLIELRRLRGKAERHERLKKRNRGRHAE